LQRFGHEGTFEDEIGKLFMVAPLQRPVFRECFLFTTGEQSDTEIFSFVFSVVEDLQARL
jgi:hypothetical protein